jgi:HlyD family secretion protein
MEFIFLSMVQVGLLRMILNLEPGIGYIEHTMKRTLITVLSIALVLIASLFIWRTMSGGPQVVSITALELEPLESSIATNGTIEASREYELRAPVAGNCQRILVQEGAAIKAGEPIVTLSDPQLDSELAAARAELESAEVDLRDIRRGSTAEEINQAEADVVRYRLELNNAQTTLEKNEWLYERHAVPRFDVEQSRREVELLEQSLKAAVTRRNDFEKRYDDIDRRRALSRIEAAKARIKYVESKSSRLIIRAPADGTLFHFRVKDGAFLNAGDLIGLFADLTDLRVRAYVDEPDLGRVSLGTKAVILWDAHPGESWNAVVDYIPSEVVEYRSRSVAEVLCKIEGSPLPLMPNINVDVEMLLPQGPKVPSLPREAVLPGDDGYFVWLVRDNRAFRQTVQTGRSTVMRIEITDGISPQDKVIIPGDVPLVEGMQIQGSGQ